MPTFEDLELTITASVDFEVFCGTCGTGLCNESDTRFSHNRAYPQVTVRACQNCIDSAVNERQADLKDIIESLKDQIDLLEEELEHLKDNREE